MPLIEHGDIDEVIKIKKGDIVYYSGGLVKIIFIPLSRSYVTIRPLGSKMKASLAIEGKFSQEGLLAMTQGEDMSTALAKTLVDSLEVEGAEDIWRKINEKNAEMTGKEVTEDLQSEPSDEKESEKVKESTTKPKPIKKDPNKVVYVDFMSFVGNKRKKRMVKKMALTQAEFDDMISQEEKQIQVQFSLF